MPIRHARGIAGRLVYQKAAIVRLRDAFKQRVFPAFDSVMDEAIAIAEQELVRLREEYKDDPNVVVTWEDAWEEGRVYYNDMDRLLHVLRNMLTAALYHLFEQQLIDLWSDLTYEVSKDRPSTPSLREILATFHDLGLECTSFRTWPVIEELRLAANVVKHGKGPASRELIARNRQLFPMDNTFQPFVGQPLGGHGFVAWRWETYFDAVSEFWDEMSEAFLKCADA